jgi:hypothetical protein
MAQKKVWLNWNDDRIWWNGPNSGPDGTIDFIWSEVFIIIEVGEAIGGGGVGGLIPDKDPWDWIDKKIEKKVEKEKREKFKQIVIRVNGIEKVKKEGDEPKITVDHIRNTFNYFGINVKLDSEPDEIETKPIEINDSSKSRPRVVISEPIVSKNDDI